MKKNVLWLLLMLISAASYAQVEKNVYFKVGLGASSVTKLKYYESAVDFGKSYLKPSFTIGGGIIFKGKPPRSKKVTRFSFTHEILLTSGGYGIKTPTYYVNQNFYCFLFPITYNSYHISGLTITGGIQPSLLFMSTVKSDVTTKADWLKFNDLDVSALLGAELRNESKLTPGIRLTYAFTPTIESGIRKYSALIYLNYNLFTHPPKKATI